MEAASLPPAGEPAEALLGRIRDLRDTDLPTTGGQTWQYSYDTGRAEVSKLAGEAFLAGLGANALDPTAFPSVMSLENEVVAMTAGLLGGGPGTAGTFTSGGTESIFLAVKAARDSRPDVERPRLVAPISAHAAFHKASKYLGIELVAAGLDPVTLAADVASVEAALDERTVLVVASAYGFAHGVIDPVSEIAALAAERGVRCHVDACMGGLILPFLRELGEPLPDFDLSVPGVTSMSADLHKFGYAPKGASVVLFRDADLRRGSYYACARWPGYTLANTTVQSSRSGGPLAAAWAVMRSLGREGYLELARQTLESSRRIRGGVEGIPELRILGEPQANTFALAAAEGTGIDVFVLSDVLRSRGWYLTPQLRIGPCPRSLNLAIDAGSLAAAGGLVEALAAGVATAAERGPVEPNPAATEALAALDPAKLDAAAFGALLERTGVSIEHGFAEVNNLLDAAEPEVREAVVLGFLGTLFPPLS
ncbi:MAG TPA: aspartate aminotransferase family protein [Thermoleophilaceae bacterium]|nr:aspartate aminotransferase family protein [Thermoleophilaceae bacterium]